jgi:hypothetical protein
MRDENHRATPKEIAEQLWRPYLIEKDSYLLAAYLKLGGEITDEVLRAIIQELENEVKRPHRSSDPWDDYCFYIDVDWQRIDGSSLEEKIGEISIDKNISESTLRRKYQRGRKVSLEHSESLDRD